MKLYHHINGTENADQETINNILVNGLQVGHGSWSDIDELLPNRPRGIYFWGEENKGAALSDRVVVSTDDIDTDHLFAFPAEASEIANLIISGYALVAEAYKFMAAAAPVPFSEFTGEFAAEWIYTADIPAHIIKKG